MKSVLDATARAEIIRRIDSLDPDAQPLWGQMNVYQMLRHCALAEAMYLGHKSYKRVFLGRIFGKSALKGMVKDDAPLGKNARTSPLFKVDGDGDVAAQKTELIELIKGYEHFSKDGIVHWFFGFMNREDIGIFSYKHLDHHLRQFNA